MLSAPKIDAHQHFWRYSPQEYGWIGPRDKVLRRDFLPADLQPELMSSGIQGALSVQARQSLEETRWLLELASQYPFIKGVVGWVPLIAEDVEKSLELFSTDKNLKGVRHVLHDEADDNYMLRGDFNAGIHLLRKFNLVYDILIFERHLPQTIELVDLHPDQMFVVDHIAKPKIRERITEPWRTNIQALAQRSHVYCKLSGVVTEADHQGWQIGDLKPYFDTILECFGPERLMFGSDWPVCLLASGYRRWSETVQDLIAKLTTAEQAAIMGGTAIRTYSLK